MAVTNLQRGSEAKTSGRRAIALAVGAMLTGLGTAQAEMIQDALSDAYRSNPQLAAQRAALRATDETVPQALANWRPTVTVTGQAGVAHDDQKQEELTADRQHNVPGGTNTYTKVMRHVGSTNLQITQPIYRGGRTQAQISQAENNVQQGRANLQATEQTVLADAATAYMNLVRDLAVLQLNINNEQNLGRQLQATRDRFQVGDVTRTDVAQAESSLANAVAGRIQAEGNVTASRATFVRVIGREPGTLLPATPLTELPGTAAAAAAAAANVPAVVAARFAAAAARNAIDVIAGQKLPTVTLQGDIQRQYQTSSLGQRRDTFDILAVVSIPIYQAGLTDAQTRAAKQTAGQLRLNIDDSLNRARESATTFYQQLNTARSRITSFETQVRASGIALDGVLQEARVGSRTVLDTLNAQQDLLNAQTNLVSSQRDAVVASYQLKGAIGQLSAQNLGLNVEVYDPTVYYEQARRRWIGTSIPQEFDATLKR
jgi:TolC family type I secretion outer membrane protein